MRARAGTTIRSAARRGENKRGIWVMVQQGFDDVTDVIIVGSGSAALAAALTAAKAGASVSVFEKSSYFGGTSAMSGAGTWIPANKYMREAGLNDSLEEALAYLRATAPEGW